MKIDNATVTVLKNFAKINPSILIKEGNTIKTMNTNKSILARATIATGFDKKFAIYNLDRFLSTLSLFNNPDLEFNDKFVNIIDSNRKMEYGYADESLIPATPDKEIKLPSVDAEFKLTEESLKEVEKALGILALPEIVVSGDGKNLYLKAADIKTASSDSYSVLIGETDKTFNAVFKAENLRIIPGEYDVKVSSKGISHFKGKEAEYWIAVEQHSTF